MAVLKLRPQPKEEQLLCTCLHLQSAEVFEVHTARCKKKPFSIFSKRYSSKTSTHNADCFLLLLLFIYMLHMSELKGDLNQW